MEHVQQDSTLAYSFNPNFITDYKGYVLGMSTEEIDRLHNFRAKNAFVNSVREFQEVTLVSDSLLKVISRHFRFPDWVQQPKRSFYSNADYSDAEPSVNNEGEPYAATGASKIPVEALPKKDLNSATAADLMEIFGVGEVLSNRIIKFRDRLGGFVVENQLEHVYGLDKEVVARILDSFRIVGAPNIVKVNINEAPASELAKLVYINYKLANGIVAYREYNGVISSFHQLSDIEDFPIEKIDIIQLYLQL